MSTPHIKGAKRGKVGVAINTDHGYVLTVMEVVGYPTMEEVLEHIMKEQEHELRQKHLPVNGWCRRPERETKRIKLVSKHMNTRVHIKRHDYACVSLPDNYVLKVK